LFEELLRHKNIKIERIVRRDIPLRKMVGMIKKKTSGLLFCKAPDQFSSESGDEV